MIQIIFCPLDLIKQEKLTGNPNLVLMVCYAWYNLFARFSKGYRYDVI
jgi:hypothetical protein